MLYKVDKILIATVLVLSMVGGGLGAALNNLLNPEGPPVWLSATVGAIGSSSMLGMGFIIGSTLLLYCSWKSGEIKKLQKAFSVLMPILGIGVLISILSLLGAVIISIFFL